MFKCKLFNWKDVIVVMESIHLNSNLLEKVKFGFKMFKFKHNHNKIKKSKVQSEILE